MTTAFCSSCGSPFSRKSDEAWKVLCYACWKRSRAAPTTFGETASHLRHELHEALIEVAQLRARLREVERRSVIPPDILQRLIALAHPDKHCGSRIATEATQWLLKQREARR